MEDTLRYFFSAIFQGIAAILTLGSMFYLSYLEKINSRIQNLIIETNKIYFPPKKAIVEILGSDIIQHLKKNYLPTMDQKSELFETYCYIISEYEKLKNKKDKLDDKLPGILMFGLLILILSTICLFSIGYYDWLNIAVFVIGVFTTILTLSFLYNTVEIIFYTFDYEYFFAIKKLNLYFGKMRK